MVKEIGMLFKTEMVQAILAGRKSHTMRLVKPQPLYDVWRFEKIKCPYQVGDIIWVRETWKDFRALSGHVLYKASDPAPNDEMFKWKPSIHMPRWAARIFLEVLNVKPMRVQDITEKEAEQEGAFTLLDEIKQNAARRGSLTEKNHVGPIEYFAWYWDTITKSGFRFKDNPWCWQIEFRKIREVDCKGDQEMPNRRLISTCRSNMYMHYR